MQLEKNDRVKVVDEDFEGKVVQVSGESVVIECKDGFEYTFAIYDLIKIKEDGESEHRVKPISLEIEKKKVAQPIRSFIELKGAKPIVDLHLEELCPEEQFSSNHEALSYQLHHCRVVIETAIQKRIRNIVFIHGVGAGKLKLELRSMLEENYPTIEFFDASYNLFGGGATEIIIHRLNQL